MTLRRRTAIQLLRDVPLLAASSDDELAQIADMADELTVAQGHYLVREGHRGGLFTLILEGTADVHVSGERVRSLGPGDFVGEIAMVLGGRRTATVVATSDVRAMCLPDRSLQQLLSRSPGLRTTLEHEAWERMEGSPAHESP